MFNIVDEKRVPNDIREKLLDTEKLFNTIYDTVMANEENYPDHVYNHKIKDSRYFVEFPYENYESEYGIMLRSTYLVENTGEVSFQYTIFEESIDGISGSKEKDGTYTQALDFCNTQLNDHLIYGGGFLVYAILESGQDTATPEDIKHVGFKGTVNVSKMGFEDIEAHYLTGMLIPMIVGTLRYPIFLHDEYKLYLEELEECQNR